MPELPEVETIVRDLRHHVTGRTITGIVFRDAALEHLIQTDPEKFYQGLLNQSITTIIRKGKYILLPLSNANVIVIHLGMTGKLWLYESPEDESEEIFEGYEYMDKHTHLMFELSGEDETIDLHLNDVRLFGNVWLAEKVENIGKINVPGLVDLGEDALGIALPDFSEIMHSKRSVKAILLDQTKIAGVGNIYADEACFCAGVHPASKGIHLTKEKVGKLWFAIKTVLKQGIKYKGSSTSDYTTPDGSKGSYQHHHRVYRKAGDKCVECGTVIERIKLVGRSTHFCPNCQEEGD